MKDIEVSDKQRILEIVAVIITALGKFVFMDTLNLRFQFVALATISWLTYIIVRYKKNPNSIKLWGFRTDNFKEVLRYMLPFALGSLVIIVTLGYFLDTINYTWHIFPILISYPIWGVIQQFLTIALIAGNLKHLKSIQLSNAFIVVSTALLFSIVHYPSGWLMLATFFLALFYGIVFLKKQNVYVMGLFHGWLGAIFYYVVLGQDPFNDVFLKLIN